MAGLRSLDSSSIEGFERGQAPEKPTILFLDLWMKFAKPRYLASYGIILRNTYVPLLTTHRPCFTGYKK